MDNVHPMEGKRRCTATNRQGNRCGRAPIPGGTVCVMHGGKIPAVKRKAQLRLLELVDPAIVTMGRIMVDQSQPPHARLRAAENVLDRVGVTRKVDLDADTARELLVERLLSMSEQDNNGDTGGQDTPSPQD